MRPGFISSDSLIASPGSSINGHNFFGYCFNNPVNLSDETGYWPRWITATIAVGGAVVAVGAAVFAAPAVAVTAAVVAIASTGLYNVQSNHFDRRKELNTNLPQTENDALAAGWHGPKAAIPGPAADCHQYTAVNGPNTKYVSPDGYRETIYDSQGQLVIDSRDVGTYNFSPSGTFWGSVGHFFVDIVPWFLFGNDDDDPGPVLNEVISLLE